MGDIFPGLTPHKSGGGAYATADDLLLLSDLCELDIVVDRWKRGGTPLRIRIKALDFDQQEKIERLALVKVDGKLVRSEAAFAAYTLFESLVVPKLTLEQAQAMRKHNPQIITNIVTFIWNTLSIIDQDIIDAIVESEIPNTVEPPINEATDAGGADDPPIAAFAAAEVLHAA
jgi:hypothetical protein